jgi:hypothetical protein
MIIILKFNLKGLSIRDLVLSIQNNGLEIIEYVVGDTYMLIAVSTNGEHNETI